MAQQLGQPERDAITTALELLVDEHGSQQKVAKLLGISQPAIHRAIALGTGGPAMMLALQNALKMNQDEFLKKYGKGVRPAEVSAVVRQVVESRDWFPEVKQALEVMYRANSSWGSKELELLGLQLNGYVSLMKRT